MIVHLFEDQKFVDITIENFESVSSGMNKYIVFSDNKKLRYVSRKEDVIVLPNSSYKLDVDLVYEDCQLLIIHFLTPLNLFILKNKPPQVKVIWSVWGADAYDHFRGQNIFEPLTRNIRDKSLYQLLKPSILYTYYHFLRYRVKPVKKELKLLKSFDYVITVLPYEFHIFSEKFRLTAKYIDYSYGINNFDEFSNASLGNAILVGNSATASNNHLDVFDIIKDTNKKLLVPLSYGSYDYKNYKKLVISEGMRIFKNSFTPIEEFMPLQDYRELTSSCNSVIMYHIRQQALGNIFMALFQGMRVFLNSKSLTYSYLKDEGMIIFDLKQDYKLIGIELNEEQKRINKEIVLNLRSREVIKEKTKGIIDLYNRLDIENFK
jgi:dTDP-N-acetylfucosamine:lipid II N-acetylfucosaminyltransferase